MDPQSFPQITIPKPCHEDWNKMTPDERGAYCAVCSKSVWDFTSKSPDEVKTILMRQAGEKLCGRFRKDQLTQPAELELPMHLLRVNNLSSLARFAFAAFAVFGTSLFSCTNIQGQMVGKVRVTEYHEPNVRGEVAIIKENEPTSDMPDSSMQAESPIKGDTTVSFLPKCHTVGEVNLLPETVDTSDKDEPVEIMPPEVIISAQKTLSNEMNVMTGAVVFTMSCGLMSVDTVSKIETEPAEIIDASPVRMVIFPNPTDRVVNLRYSVEKETEVTIEVYDLNGKMLKQLAKNQKRDTGDYQVSFDVSNFSSGTYLCRLQAGLTWQTARFVKAE